MIRNALYSAAIGLSLLIGNPARGFDLDDQFVEPEEYERFLEVATPQQITEVQNFAQNYTHIRVLILALDGTRKLIEKKLEKDTPEMMAPILDLTDPEGNYLPPKIRVGPINRKKYEKLLPLPRERWEHIGLCGQVEIKTTEALGTRIYREMTKVVVIYKGEKPTQGTSRCFGKDHKILYGSIKDLEIMGEYHTQSTPQSTEFWNLLETMRYPAAATRDIITRTIKASGES
jgi:hypothetical protein